MAKETRKVHISVTSNASKDLNKGTVAASGLSGALKGVGTSANLATGGIKAMTMALISSGVGALVVAVGALVAGLANVINVSSSFEKSLSNLESITGASANEMGELSRQAKELGRTTAFTASEVVELQTSLSKLGFDTDDIKNSTASVLDLAAALDVGLGEAAEVAGSLVKSFGLETEDTQRIVDVMASAASSSALSFDTIRESMKLVAPVSRATGVSIEKTGALLGVLADNGLKGSIAGTGLAKTFIELNKQGISLEDGMKKVKESADPLKTAIDMVGVIAGKTFLTLSSGSDSIQGLEENLNNSAGAAKKMADIQLDNLSGDVTKLGSAWEGFLLGVEDGTGTISIIMRALTQGATALLGFFNATNSVTDAMEDQRLELFKLEGQLYDTNTTEEQRVAIINQLQDEYPLFLANIDAETASNEELSIAISDVNDSLVDKIILTKQDEEMQEKLEDIADAKIDLLQQEMDLRDTVAANNKKHNLKQKEGTLAQQAAEQKLQLTKMQAWRNDEVTKQRATEALFQLSESTAGVTTRTKVYNEELKEGNRLTAKYRETMEMMGIAIEKVADATEDCTGGYEEATKATTTLVGAKENELKIAKLLPESTRAELKLKNRTVQAIEIEIRKLKELGKVKIGSPEERNKEADAKKAFLDKLKKLEQDSEDASALEKIQRKRERHLDELKKVVKDKTELKTAEATIDAIYDAQRDAQIEKNNKKRKKILNDFTKQFNIEAEDPSEKLTQQREAHLLELEQLKLNETEKAEAKKSIKAFYDNEEATLKANDRILKNEQDLADLETKKQLISQGLDLAIEASGQESKIGQALFKIKQMMALAEMAMQMKTYMVEMKMNAQKAEGKLSMDAVNQSGALSEGMANSAKLGPPFNAIPMAIMAIQSGLMIKNMMKSKKEMKKITGRFGGGSIGGGTAPQAPNFNVIGQTSAGENLIADTVAGANSRPIRAFVVDKDVTSSQELSRNTEAIASIG